MKKVITVFASLICFAVTVNAQSILNKAKTMAATTSFDANSLAQLVTSQLTSKLGLTTKQVPKVTNALNTFMQAKAQIMPLLKSDKGQYTTKQAAIFDNLKTSLGTTLVKNQMNKFLSLKPATNDPTNVLSNLFY